MSTEKRNYYPLRVGKFESVIVSDTDPKRPDYGAPDSQREVDYYGGCLIAESIPPSITQDMVDAYNEKFGPVVKIHPAKLIDDIFLLSQGWKRTDDPSDLAFTSENNFTIEIIREADGLETHIYDEYGFHDGMRYNGVTPTQEQYFVLNDLLKMVPKQEKFTSPQWIDKPTDGHSVTIDGQIKWLDQISKYYRSTPGPEAIRSIKENLIAVKRWSQNRLWSQLDIEKVIEDLLYYMKPLIAFDDERKEKKIEIIQNAEYALGILQAFKQKRDKKSTVPEWVKVVNHKDKLIEEIAKRLPKNPEGNYQTSRTIIFAIDEMLKLRGL